MVGPVVLPRATQERGSQPDCATSIKNLSTGDGTSRLAMAPRHPTSCWRVLQPEWADTGRHIGTNPATLPRTPFGERSLGSSASSRSNPDGAHSSGVIRNVYRGLNRASSVRGISFRWERRCGVAASPVSRIAVARRRSHASPCALAPPSSAGRSRQPHPRPGAVIGPPLRRRNSARAKPRRSSGVPPPPRWLTGAARAAVRPGLLSLEG